MIKTSKLFKVQELLYHQCQQFLNCQIHKVQILEDHLLNNYRENKQNNYLNKILLKVQILEMNKQLKQILKINNQEQRAQILEELQNHQKKQEYNHQNSQIQLKAQILEMNKHLKQILKINNREQKAQILEELYNHQKKQEYSHQNSQIQLKAQILGDNNHLQDQQLHQDLQNQDSLQ